ncbi:MAG: hypothetical protein RI924_1464 [Bacteroidota bacterium]|jgi:hypothetical protein
MKQKIYLVEERMDVSGDLRVRALRAFLCKRTAKKFTGYKNQKLTEQKHKLETFNPPNLGLCISKKDQKLKEKCEQVFSISEYGWIEVDLY